MWRFTFLIFAAVLLSAAKVSQARISSSLLYEIAEMMREPVEEIGRCDTGCCVEIEREDGSTERQLLELGETVTSPKNSCHLYRCEVSGVKLVVIDECENRPCESGKKPVLYPNECCPKCIGQPTEGECKFTDWSDFGPCSLTCDGGVGQGQKVRVRRLISVGDNADFLNCTGALNEVMPCTAPPCEINCEWMPAESGECLPNCGGGIIERYYIITQEPAHGGKDCPPVVRENITEVIECCRDCKWEEREKGNCLPQCGGGGFKEIYYVITQTAAGGGAECPNFVHENETVVLECCAHCKWEEREKGNCLPQCGGGGFKEKYYVITQQAAGGGDECPNFVHENETVVIECCAHCKWEEREKGNCLPQCGGGGFKEKYYVITQQAGGGGDECPNFVHENETVVIECCENCTWEYRSTECSESCDGGTRIVYPVILTPAKGGGFCPDDVVNNVTKTETCNNEPCECEFEECEVDGMKFCVNPIDDPDKDCIETDKDNCPNTFNPDQSDQDNDGIGDACDSCNKTGPEGPVDRDFDDVEDPCDNCLQKFNPDQENNDDDESGDACDADDDNDGIIDTSDNCQYVVNADQKDSDSDSIGELCDNCPDKKNTNQADKDGDKRGNACDNCRFVPNYDQTDTDGDGVGDACEGRAQDYYYDHGYYEPEDTASEKNLLVRIMEKLLDMISSK